MNISVVRYLLLAAMRDKLVYSLLGASVLVVSLSFFLGSSAVVEQDQFVLVYVASTIRMLFVFGLVLFTVFFVRRSFENKDIEYLLSRPMDRKSFVFSYIIALVVLSLFFALVASLIVAFVGQNYWGSGYALWCYSFLVAVWSCWRCWIWHYLCSGDSFCDRSWGGIHD